eukprot:3382023-Pyramimonas_sp.AAC.3
MGRERVLRVWLGFDYVSNAFYERRSKITLLDTKMRKMQTRTIGCRCFSNGSTHPIECISSPPAHHDRSFPNTLPTPHEASRALVTQAYTTQQIRNDGGSVVDPVLPDQKSVSDLH